MNRILILATAMTGAFGLGLFFNSVFYSDQKQAIQIQQKPNTGMKLGAFSISLSVQDLNVSKAFYENLGFSQFGGSMDSNYLIMKNESTLIGLFQGMFEGNILTFNPGWDENAQPLKEYNDVREIQQKLQSSKIEIVNPSDQSTTGPASFMVTDPDGNIILFDQHL